MWRDKLLSSFPLVHLFCRRNMQGNTEANGENGFRRANVMKRIEILRRRRRSREVAKTGSSSRRWRSARIPIPPTPPARVRLLNLSTKIFYHLFQRLKVFLKIQMGKNTWFLLFLKSDIHDELIDLFIYLFS